MGRLVKAGKKHLSVRQAALDAVQGLAQKDWAGEVRALHAWVRDRVRFTRDIRGVETIQTPDITLALGQGDCDDKSVLLASMLESIGHPSRFVAIGFAPEEFEHVYVESKVGQNWVPLDATEPVQAGWSPKRTVSRLVFFN